MNRPAPIIDAYGTLLDVGGWPDEAMVRLGREEHGEPNYDRLTPDQAEDLGKRLIEAAKATRR